jgi:flagellar export protein FliJ
MSFHFTLNGVLRLRQSLERAELQRLQSLAAAVARMRDEIESLEKQMETAQRRVSDVVAGTGMTGAELHFEMAREVCLHVLRSEFLKKLSELEQQRNAQQGRYLQARMKREILSNLRKRQLADYDLDQSRREQQRIDELFLIRSFSSSK